MTITILHLLLFIYKLSFDNNNNVTLLLIFSLFFLLCPFVPFKSNRNDKSKRAKRGNICAAKKKNDKDGTILNIQYNRIDQNQNNYSIITIESYMLYRSLIDTCCCDGKYSMYSIDSDHPFLLYDPIVAIIHSSPNIDRIHPLRFIHPLI
jgi:hypothetical protein